jgi:hypothetical protein
MFARAREREKLDAQKDRWVGGVAGHAGQFFEAGPKQKKSSSRLPSCLLPLLLLLLFASWKKKSRVFM